METPTTLVYNDLPADHLVKLIHREEWRDSDLRRRPVVDWETVLERLSTTKGQQELKEWVQMPTRTNNNNRSSGLFLHHLCEFDFGSGCGLLLPSTNDNRDGDDDILPLLDSSIISLSLLKKVVDLYPEAVKLPTSDGYYPLHILCNRNLSLGHHGRQHGHGITSLPWREETVEAIHFLLKLYPDAVTKITTNRHQTAMHLVLDSLPPASRDDDNTQHHIMNMTGQLIETMLDLWPQALEVSDVDGRNPLNVACCCRHDGGMKVKFNILRKMVETFPQQALCRAKAGDVYGGRTPLLSFLRGYCNNRYYHHLDDDESSNNDDSNDDSLLLDDVFDMFVEVCPWSIFVLDLGTLKTNSQGELEFAGDALDYLCCSYIERLNGMNLLEFDEQSMRQHRYRYERRNYIGGFIKANASYVLAPHATKELYSSSYPSRGGSAENLFASVEKILQLLHGREERYISPLHAMCTGSICRPWYLAIYQQILIRYRDQSRIKDENGNLPLHLFLKSCLAEQKRAIRKGYAKDGRDYSMAVSLCFNMILGSNPDAAGIPDQDGSYPLHLAIRNNLQGDIIESLLFHAPNTLLTCEPKSKLPAFALAGVFWQTENNNLDTIFTLLQKDPTIIKHLLL